MTNLGKPEIPSVPDHDALMEQLYLARQASMQIPGGFEKRNGNLLGTTIETIQPGNGAKEPKIEIERRKEDIGLDEPIKVVNVTAGTPTGVRVDYEHIQYPDGAVQSRGNVRVGDTNTPNTQSASALMKLVAEGVEGSARTAHQRQRKLK